MSIRGIQGRVYHDKDTNRVVGIHTEGEFAGQIMKAQPLVPCAAAVVMPLPPVAIHRLSPIEQDRIRNANMVKHQIATIPESKVDKIRLTTDFL